MSGGALRCPLSSRVGTGASGGGGWSAFFGLREERCCEDRPDGVAPNVNLAVSREHPASNLIEPEVSFISFLCREDFRFVEVADAGAEGKLLSDDSSWGPEDGLFALLVASLQCLLITLMSYPAFDMLAAARLRLRVFGGDGAGGTGAGASCCCCSSTLARFLRGRLLESDVPAATVAAAGVC